MRNLVAIQRAPAWAVFLLLLFSSPATPSEQDPFKYEQAWALNGPCCGDSGHDIAVDPDGSFFIVGNYGALDLDGDGRADLKSEGGHDAIIMKGRPTGKLAWVRAPRSPAMSFARLTVASDRRGGAYLAGGFQDSMQFLSGVRVVARGATEGLLVRYDAEGDALWARAIGGERLDSLADVSVDAAGHVYVTGRIQDAVDLDADGRVGLPAPGVEGAPFVAHFDPGGRLNSAIALLGAGDSRIGNLAHAANGDLVASGYTQGSVDLNGDGQADVVSIDNRATPFVARFDRKGTLLWVRAFSQKERVAILDNDGAIRQVLAVTGPGHDQPRGVAFAPDGQSLSLTGFVRLTADFDGDGVPEGGVRCDNDGDIVWARYQLQPR